MDVAIYLAVALLIVVLLVLVTFLRRSSGPGAAAVNEERRPHGVPVNRQEGPAGVRRRGARQRMRAGAEDSDEEEGDIFDDIAQPEGKIGAKKMRKLEEKAAKKAEREAVERDREEQKKQDALREERRKREEELQKINEEKTAEEERKRKEEEERQAHEEYLKMKEMFTVDEEGQTELLSDEQQQGLLQEFINYIKKMKVIMLEDLAAHFGLKSQDAIDRVNQLVEMGDLTGVMDDRGKFIYITNEEYAAVAKFIRQRGRVSISELAESSNKLINLNPDNKDVYEKQVMKEMVSV